MQETPRLEGCEEGELNSFRSTANDNDREESGAKHAEHVRSGGATGGVPATAVAGPRIKVSPLKRQMPVSHVVHRDLDALARINDACPALTADDLPSFERCHVDPRLRDRWVYIAKAGWMYKIGIATDVDARMRGLTTVGPIRGPVELLVAFAGSWNLEQWLHGQFARARSHGEWFYPVQRIDHLAWSIRRSPHVIKWRSSQQTWTPLMPDAHRTRPRSRRRRVSA